MLDNIMEHSGAIFVVVATLIALNMWRSVLAFFGIIVVPDDSIGMVVKKFKLLGANRTLPDGKIIALNGEAGYQADTLSPGLHFWLWPWQYTIDLRPFTTIPQGKIGIVQACDGRPLPSGRIVGKHVESDYFQDARAFLTGGGERGPQMIVIPSGTWRINTLLFQVKQVDATEIPQGQVGVVEAFDGQALPAGRVIAMGVDCDSYQDASAFMAKGGERGPQTKLIPSGNYRINPYMFNVEPVRVVDIPDNKVGIVTTKEGRPLSKGEIAGETVEGHNMYQDPDKFISNGGYKGLQEQVLLAGRYFLNPRFVSVEIADMTLVPIANVGVVIAYVGKEGTDVTGDEFKHGNLVSMGEKGVWATPLDPGKYPINPYTHRVVCVPTANVVLNWADAKSEAHNLDANLSTITVRSSDGFKYNLDVAQIIHIPSKDAPKVIARFGEMSALVTQVLEPTIGNYFRNAAQGSDIIEFLRNRSLRQEEACNAISAALKEYNVGAVDTLIGDIVPPEELMRTLTDRKLAEQERVTYETQREAQQVRQKLEQDTALANTQARVVDAERNVEINKYNASASVEQAKGVAEAKTIQANADAQVLKLVGDAEGAKIQAVGGAEAEVIQKKVASMGESNFSLVQIAEALAKGHIKIVPDIVAGGGDGMGGGIVQALLGNLLHQGMASHEVGKRVVDPVTDTHATGEVVSGSGVTAASVAAAKKEVASLPKDEGQV